MTRRASVVQADKVFTPTMVVIRLRQRSVDIHNVMKHEGEWLLCPEFVCTVDREMIKEAFIIDRRTNG